MPRPPSAKSVLKQLSKKNFEPKTPIASGMFIPNLSGDLSRAHINTQPTLDQQPANKLYVDNTVVTTFTGLTDTPAAYVTANALYGVNTGGTAVEEKAVTYNGTTLVVPENFSIPLTKKLYLDGDGGNTYITTGTSSALDFMDFYVAGNRFMLFWRSAGDWWIQNSMGTQYLDNKLTHYGTNLGSDAQLGHVTTLTPDGFILGVGTENNSFIICEEADILFDFAHALQTNPTLFIHSANQSTTQWGSLAHDQTNFVISTGAGGVDVNAANLAVDAGKQIFFDGLAGHTYLQETTNDDLRFVIGGTLRLQINNTGAPIIFWSNSRQNDNNWAYWGSGSDCVIMYSVGQTPDAWVFGTSVDSNAFIICELADVTFDKAHALQTNPTLFIHSANQSTTQWISFTHDQTDGVIDVGTGLIKLADPLKLGSIKSGATQAAAGAAAGEVWKTASHATLPDNVLMIGV